MNCKAVKSEQWGKALLSDAGALVAVQARVAEIQRLQMKFEQAEARAAALAADQQQAACKHEELLKVPC